MMFRRITRSYNLRFNSKKYSNVFKNINIEKQGCLKIDISKKIKASHIFKENNFIRPTISRSFSKNNEYEFIVEDGTETNENFDNYEENYEKTYTPKEKLKFEKDGFCLLGFSERLSNHAKMMKIVVYGTLLISGFCFYQLIIKYNERGYFGLFFYSTIGLTTSFACFRTSSLLRSLIRKIKIDKTGKKVKFISYCAFKPERVVDVKRVHTQPFLKHLKEQNIEDIKNLQEIQGLALGYPIGVGMKVVHLPVDLKKIHPDVLGKVLNGSYINIKE